MKGEICPRCGLYVRNDHVHNRYCKSKPAAKDRQKPKKGEIWEYTQNSGARRAFSYRVTITEVKKVDNIMRVFGKPTYRDGYETQWFRSLKYFMEHATRVEHLNDKLDDLIEKPKLPEIGRQYGVRSAHGAIEAIVKVEGVFPGRSLSEVHLEIMGSNKGQWNVDRLSLKAFWKFVRYYDKHYEPKKEKTQEELPTEIKEYMEQDAWNSAMIHGINLHQEKEKKEEVRETMAKFNIRVLREQIAGARVKTQDAIAEGQKAGSKALTALMSEFKKTGKNTSAKEKILLSSAEVPIDDYDKALDFIALLAGEEVDQKDLPFDAMNLIRNGGNVTNAKRMVSIVVT